MQQHTIHIAGGVVRNPLVRLSNPVTLDFLDGEHIAIAGPNGAGKSLLVDLLTGKYPLRDGTLAYDFRPSATQTVYDNIRYIAFRDTYGSADANYYYQQRWNAHDQEDAPLVRDLLGEPHWDGHDALEFVASVEEKWKLSACMPYSFLMISRSQSPAVIPRNPILYVFSANSYSEPCA